LRGWVEVRGLGSSRVGRCGCSIGLGHNAMQVVGGEISEISDFHADGLATKQRIELLTQVRFSCRIPDAIRCNRGRGKV
jgi:hypothetical protein